MWEGEWSTKLPNFCAHHHSTQFEFQWRTVFHHELWEIVLRIPGSSPYSITNPGWHQQFIASPRQKLLAIRFGGKKMASNCSPKIKASKIGRLFQFFAILVFFNLEVALQNWSEWNFWPAICSSGNLTFFLDKNNFGASAGRKNYEFHSVKTFGAQKLVLQICRANADSALQIRGPKGSISNLEGQPRLWLPNWRVNKFGFFVESDNA